MLRRKRFQYEKRRTQGGKKMGKCEKWPKLSAFFEVGKENDFPFPVAICGRKVYNCGRKWEKHMLIGKKEQTLDDKNRVVLPTIYRNDFPQGAMVFASLGLDPCIEIFPEAVYQQKIAEFAKMSNFDPKVRSTKRTFFANTFQLQIDSHNRVLLPRELLDKLHISKKVVILGVIDCVEIWDKDVYDKRETLERENFSQNAQDVMGRGSC